MAILLDAQQLTASFGARPLFDGVSFTVDEKERIGLIGPNGAGKSTLLRILAETASADRGTIARRRGLRVAFLDQTPRFADGATVRDAILEGIDAAHDSPDAHEQERRVFATLALDAAGGGLGPDTPIALLSGGWKKRVAIGRALARQPDLLLLDEPTNHLDVEGIEWLEALLSRRGAAFATITVTHDRLFLQRVTTRILELDRRNPGGLLSVAGDYATYVRVKARDDARAGAARGGPAQHAAPRDRVAAARRGRPLDQAAGAHRARRHARRRGRGARAPQPDADRDAGLRRRRSAAAAPDRGARDREELRRAPDLRGDRPAPRPRRPRRPARPERLRQVDADPRAARRGGAVGRHRRARRRTAGGVLPAEPRGARTGRARWPTPSAPTAITSPSAARACTCAATSSASCSSTTRCRCRSASSRAASRAACCSPS